MERRLAQIKIAKHVRRCFARKAFKKIIQEAVQSSHADGHGLQACHSRIAVGREMIQWEQSFITKLSAIVDVVMAVSAEMLDQLDPPATDAFSVFKTSIVTLRDVHQVIDADLKRVLKLETGQKGRLSVVFKNMAKVIKSSHRLCLGRQSL